MTPVAAATTNVHIGVILVHGIGDHKQFQHLDAEMRPLLDAIERWVKTQPHYSAGGPRNVTVEIAGGSSSAVQAERDTWNTKSGAPVRVIVRESENKIEHLHIHEVWWADVDEPYSLWKQIKFWGWGLSVWNVGEKANFDLPEAEQTMALPEFTGGEKTSILWLRFRLLCVCNVFAMAGFSLGALVFFAKRLLSFDAPDIVKILVNYISAVKLYSQEKRSDGGFLDAYLEPPRVSIRRRMVRTIADAAHANYDRWYVVAHSLGSVVAFNGLMENARAIPNYLTEAQFRDLEKGLKDRNNPGAFHGDALAGPKRDDGDEYVGSVAKMLPARPVWLKDNDVVYRDRLFSKFHGLLTYGSPLDKFAAIWPPRVPINWRETGLGEKPREWINVYDPTDPVSAKLDAFAAPKKAKANVVLEPTNVAYAAHPLLLYSHLRYFDAEKDRSSLADRIIDWMMTGQSFSLPTDADKSLWLPAKNFWRSFRAISMWIIAYLILTVLGVLSLPLWKSLIVDGGGALARMIVKLWKDTFGSTDGAPVHWLMGFIDRVGTCVWRGLTTSIDFVLSILSSFDRMLHWLLAWPFIPDFVNDMIRLSIYVLFITLIAGGILRWRLPSDPPADSASGAVTAPTSGGRTSEFKPAPVDDAGGGVVVSR